MPLKVTVHKEVILGNGWAPDWKWRHLLSKEGAIVAFFENDVDSFLVDVFLDEDGGLAGIIQSVELV